MGFFSRATIIGNNSRNKSPVVRRIKDKGKAFGYLLIFYENLDNNLGRKSCISNCKPLDFNLIHYKTG